MKIHHNINNQIVERLGFYQVGSTRYNNKIDALIASTKTNTPVSWYFNNDVYSQVTWQTQPQESLQEIYRQRALQLREKYDYLVLNYSAGSDSQNILDTFLLHDIPIDEVCVRWAIDGYSQYRPSRLSQPDNVHSEWHYAIVPGLEKLRQLRPNIHIELVDVTHDAFTMFDDMDPWYHATTGAIPSPGHINRWILGLDRYQKMFVDKGIRCCQIFGTDKPRLMYDQGQFYTFFLDVIAGTPRNLINYNDEYNALELFYWSPDMPKIVQKQAHVMMDFFRVNQNLLPVISKDNALSWVFRNTFETICRSLIYPTWNAGVFQAPKPTNMVTCEVDDWYFETIRSCTKERRSYDIWLDSINHIKKNVDDSWLVLDHRGNLNSLTGMISPLYKVGEL